jgi:hypothetical protein
MNEGEVTPLDVARWMKKRLQNAGVLYQEAAVDGILDEFGAKFLRINRNGNYAIDQSVLHEFRDLTQGDVVWVRGERMWRRREAHDRPGSRQA